MVTIHHFSIVYFPVCLIRNFMLNYSAFFAETLMFQKDKKKKTVINTIPYLNLKLLFEIF